MHSRFVISNAELTMCVHAPAPGKALVIDSDVHIAPQAHIDDTIRDCQDFLRIGRISPETSTPEEKFSFVCNASRVEIGIHLDNSPVRERLN